MEGNFSNHSGNRTQEQQNGDRQNRNGQSHFQNAINNPAGVYQPQRSQQSPTDQSQNTMGHQQQRTTRIFLPHQTTIKNPHQRQASNGGQGKGVTFLKNKRPGDMQQANREDGNDFVGYGANQMDFYMGDQQQMMQQNDANVGSLQNSLNLQDGIQNFDNQANIDHDDADVSIQASMASRIHRSSKQKQEDYTFSPRDGQVNVKHRILQPNFKKRTPSGVPPIQNINNQQLQSSNRAILQQQIEHERKKVERVKTQEQVLSMSPPILRHGATDDSNAEDFAVENEEGEAEMSAINHNSKQPLGEGQSTVKEGTVYPRMFSGKFKSHQSQRKANQINANRGGGRKQEMGEHYDGNEYFERGQGENEEDGQDEPTCSQIFYQEDQEEKNADIQLPYSQTSSPNVNGEQRYSKGQAVQKRPSKLSTTKNAEKRVTQVRKVQGTHNNSIGKQNQGAQREGGKFSLNLQGVQDKSTKLRKILSMRDPVTISQEREQEIDDDEDQNSENVYDNVLSSGDLEGADKMYSKHDVEQNRIESARQERAVHSPAEKFSSKRSNPPGDGPGTGRAKYIIKSHKNNQSKSKSNTAKIASVQKNNYVKPQPDLDNQNLAKNSNFQVRQKSGNRALIKYDNMTSGSQSARGPQTTIRGFSHSRMPISFQNQILNNQQPQQQQQAANGWQPANASASRKTFNQTQKLTLKGSSSQNLTTKQPQQKGWQKQMVDDNNSDNAEYNFIDQVEQDGDNEGETSPSKLECQGLMEMPKTNHLMSQRNRISNISSKGGARPSWQASVKQSEFATPSTLMPQQMKISPSKRKSNNQVVMMMHSTTAGSGSGSAPANTPAVTDDRMRRKGRGQQEQGNPKQTSEKYNIYNNPIQAVQVSQVYMPESMEHMEQDEDLGQEFSSPYSQFPNQQQKPRKSSVRLSNPDEEKQEIKNQNMHNMIPSASQDISSKLQHYNRLPSKSAQLSFGKRLNFQVKSLMSGKNKNPKMPCSIFDQLKEQNSESAQKEFPSSQSPSTLGIEFTQEQNTEKGTASTKFFHFSEKRIEKLYDEIYSDESGAFFGFFSSSDKNKQDKRRLETYYGTNESVGMQRDQRISPNNMSETDFSSNFNTFRDTQYQKEEYLQKKKQKNKKQVAKDQQAQNDPLILLWQELQEQDEELIFSESCQLINDSKYDNIQRMGMSSLSNLYASGIESSRGHMSVLDSSNKYRERDGSISFQPLPPRPTVIQYDFHADVHKQTYEFMMNVSSYQQMVHFFVCYQKKQYLQEFMRAKSKYFSSIDDHTKFSLRNSIIPAIQGHILILMDVPIQYKDKLMATALSARTVLRQYHKSCRTMQNWLQSIDFGPLQQHPEIDPFTQEREETAGACLSTSVSTKEFYDLKLYQVDEELPDSINTLFNPISTMYYVDRMGNLLQSIKQAFYEKSEDKSYISKMFSSDNHSAARDSLCKSYDVVREIYESILQPKRQQQLRYDIRFYQQDVKDAKNVGQRIRDGFSVEDLATVSYLNIDMHSDKSPTGLTFFDLHAHDILDISFFTMTTHQYMKVLLGLPEYDKNLGDNTQVLLKAKIDILKKSLVKSVNEHEFELVYYIRFLKSQKYNCNVFGKFNPITVNEEEIIEQMAKRR